jgi:hypothetical protein
MKKLFFLSLLALLAVHVESFAAKRYWIATTTSGWKAKANWSTTSTGLGGATVPGASDTAYFTSSRTGQCNVDSLVNVRRLEMGSGCGTVVQNANAVTIGTSGAVLAGGTFTGGSSAFTCNGSLTISGTAFTSTSNTLTCVGNFTLSSGSFANNSGTVLFTTSNTIAGTIVFNNLTFTPSATATHSISNTVTVQGTLTTSGSNTLTLNTGTIDAQGNVTISNTGSSGGGNATITISGTGTVNLDGNASANRGRLPHVTISKTGGTVTLLDTISIAGNWTCLVAADPYVQEGTSTVYFSGSKTINGNHTLNNVFVDGGTYTMNTADTVRVTGLLKYVGSTSITINTGTFIAQGNITLANTGTAGGGSGLIFIRGTAVQTFTGVSAVSSNSLLPNIEIKKDGGSITFAQVLPVRGNWTYTRGNTIHGTSTVGFNATKTITGSDTLYDVIFAGAAATFTISSGTTLHTAGTLSTLGGNALTLSTGTIKALGHVTLSNISAGTGGSATVLIGGTGAQTITGNGTAGGGALPHVTIDKPSGTLSLASIITCAGNWTYTGVGSGSINPGSSTVAFYGTGNLDGQQASAAAMMPFNNVSVNAGTTTLTGNLDVNGNFTIASGATCSAGSNTIHAGGNWNSAGTWTYGSGTVVFDGSGYNTVQGAAGAISFANVTISRTAPKNLRLLNPVLINTSMTLNKGRIYSTTANYLAFADNATCTVTNNDSAYVHGPVRKTGNDAFVFPLGDTTLHDSVAYHPLAITAPGNISDEFEARYYAQSQTAGSAKAATLNSVSGTQYWTLDKRSGSSTPSVTLHWNRNGDNTAFSEMRVAEWTGAQWTDRGQAAVVVNNPTGSVTASSALSFGSNPAQLVIANAAVSKSYSVLQKASPGGGYVNTDGYVLYFGFEDEYDDPNDSLSFSVVRLSNDRAQVLLSTPANAPLVSYGNNTYKLDLYDNASTPLAAGYYMLEVTNSKNEKWYLRFKI